MDVENDIKQLVDLIESDLVDLEKKIKRIDLLKPSMKERAIQQCGQDIREISTSKDSIKFEVDFLPTNKKAFYN